MPANAYSVAELFGSGTAPGHVNATHSCRRRSWRSPGATGSVQQPLRSRLCSRSYTSHCHPHVGLPIPKEVCRELKSML